MCGRFTVLSYDEVVAVAQALERRLEPIALDVASAGGCRAQAAPGSSIALISPSERGVPEVLSATWGFKADWSKRLVFNTRIESALGGSAMWREATERGRCLIPVASFFEPHGTETVTSPVTGRPMKRPYEFADPTGAPLLLAGLECDGHCSIVTSEPNWWVAPVHNRMPLVLRFQEVPIWFGADWHTLANRSDIELQVHPELLPPLEQDSQLSLF